MQRDELHDPLGLGREPPSAALANRHRRKVVIGACLLVGACGAGFFMISRARTSDAGVSTAIVRAAADGAVASKNAGNAPERDSSLRGNSADEQIETENGVRVIRMGGGSASGAIVHVPQSGRTDVLTQPDARLFEKSRFGLLPKIGADGSRASDVYRRPARVSDGAQAGEPRIALLIGGMGLNEGVTRSAVKELPPEVTLGFASVAADLASQVAYARKAGHEVLLQIPMEAVAADKSGHLPHELTAEASAAQNIDNLRWDMGRFPGYFGVMNYMGSKLTSDGAALGPVLQEMADRGLAYVDDGTSPLSVAPTIAADLHIPVASADVVIDAQNNPVAIAGAFNRLEAIAHSRGFALGAGAGLPTTIDGVAAFARTLRSNGFALVPVSALLAAGPTASAASSK